MLNDEERRGLVALYDNATVLHHQAETAQHNFNMVLSTMRSKYKVPPGYDIDYHGDGKVRPVEQCKKPQI